MDWRSWPKYVSVAERKQKALAKIRKLETKGEKLQPIVLEGRTITRTFWGKSWCKNLERYSDYSNRLPRGRSYVRHRAVLDLKIAPGEVTALVQGSSLYRQKVTVKKLSKKRWRELVEQCAGQLGSMLELLRGRFSAEVMRRVTDPKTGLFPNPHELSLSCSCPDWAEMCKHIAAALYGIGARLDEEPELLFVLRGVDANELVASATVDALDARQDGGGQALEGDLGDIFGIDLDEDEVAPERAKPSKKHAAKKRAKKTKIVRRKVAQSPKPKMQTRKKQAARAKQIVQRRELLERGVPASTIQSWLRHDVLKRTSTRGTYRMTRVARERLTGYPA